MCWLDYSEWLLPAGFAQGRLLVAQKGLGSLGIVDPAAGKLIASVPEGGITGHEVAASPDGRLAYVPIYGNSGVGKPGTNGRNMVVIDIAAAKVVGNLDFGHEVRPHLPVFGPKDGLLYVTTELDKAITIVDPKTLKIVGSIPTGQPESHMLAISHDGRRGYTANVGPGTVSVLDMAARKTLKVIPISGETQRISMSMDDKWVFTADQKQPRIAVIDTATDTVAKWVPLEGMGYGSVPTPDGRWLLMTEPGAEQDCRGRPEDHAGCAVSGDAERTQRKCLCSRMERRPGFRCPASAQVAEIDLATWKMTRQIVTGKSSDGLAWAKAQ